MERVYGSESEQGWKERAECRGIDPDFFFPEGSSEDIRVQKNLAKEVCAECEVRQECLDFAIVNKENYGVWGGADEKERKAIRWQRLRNQLAS